MNVTSGDNLRNPPLNFVAAAVFVLSPLAATHAMAQGELCGIYPAGQGSYTCTCTPDAAVGSVWGSGPYTTDSSLCDAAIHAGVLGFDGGTVTALATGPQDSFLGTESNGVVSADWGPYPDSFVFDQPVSAAAAADLELCGVLPEEYQVYQCACDPSVMTTGGVWGSGPYTADSNICGAATHAGMIGPEGGPVLVIRTKGQDAYQGSTLNGVTTESWGPFGSSFFFDVIYE
jgi:hypothetical protein